MSQYSVPYYVSPLAVPKSEPESIHDAGHDRQSADMNASLIWRCSGEMKQWIFGKPGEPDRYVSGFLQRDEPRAIVSALQTWTDFYIGFGALIVDPIFELPWRFTESFSNIRMFVELGTSNLAALKVRFTVTTLPSRGAVSETAHASPTKRPARRMKMEAWKDLDHSGGRMWRYDMYETWCSIDSYPTGGRCIIRPQVYVDQTAHPIVDIGGDLNVSILSITLADQEDPAKTGG